MATSVNARRGLRGLLAKIVRCRNGDLTAGHEMAKIARFRAAWFRVVIVTGVHARKAIRTTQPIGMVGLGSLFAMIRWMRNGSVSCQNCSGVNNSKSRDR
jgi:siroheme synthase